MKVIEINQPSNQAIKNMCKYLFEIIEKKNIYDKIKASK